MHEDDNAYFGAGVLTLGLAALVGLVFLGSMVAAVW